MSPDKRTSSMMSPLANAYLLTGFAALVLFGLLLVNSAGQLAMVPTLIGAAGLAFRWRTGPLLFLASVAIGELLLNWYPAGWHVSETAALPRGIGFCAAGLIYVISQYRLLGLTIGVFPSDARPSDPPPRSGSTGTRELVETLLTAAVITVSVFALWLVLRKVRRPWQIDEQHWRLGLLAWIMLGGLAIAMAVIGHLGWRRVSRAEAAMFLQDGLWHETRREQRRINRWRAWALRRR